MEKDTINKLEFNVHDGAQVIIANDNAKVSAIQKNIRSVEVKKPVKSRTQEYLKKWNNNMFLNNFDERDENAGVNVKLSDVYLDEQLPHYIWKNNKKESKDLRDLLSEYIGENSGNKMLLILGQPGIGKSSLITWITANFTNKIDDILVYQFASNLKNVIWQNLGNDIKRSLLEELNILVDDLEGKILILDGFDEISVENDRVEILNQLYWKFIEESSLNKFSLIITCRENYIDKLFKINCNYITLQSWDEEQINRFCKTFQKKTKYDICEYAIANILNNKEILGIPLILYMVLALNISIEKDGSIVDIYDRIFSLDGGIYDRCIDNRIFANKHRIGKIKKQIHQVSRDIAIWIFENNPVGAYISKEEYQIICDNIMQERDYKNENVQDDFLIGNYFKLVRHCEGIETEELYFVHRSIYEYFVVETIINDIENVLSKSKESIAAVLGNLLKGNRLSTLQLDYLKYKILKSRLNDKFDFIYGSFILMIENGMTYYTQKFYKNIIERESIVFVNMLDILHLWDNIHLELGMPICNYLVCNTQQKVNLSNAILNNTYGNYGIKILRGVSLKRAYLLGADLRGADLRQVDLTSANLAQADLRKACLRRADFYNADLREADLREAQVDWINLSSADLRGTIFNDYQIDYLKGHYNLHGTKVYLETGEIIKYEEYRNEGHKFHI